MPTLTLEDRLTAIEHELDELKQRLNAVKMAPHTYKWERILGSFAGSEGFDEAVRLGREYRESLQPGHDVESA